MINYSEIFREANEGFSVSDVLANLLNWIANNISIVILYFIIGFIMMILYVLLDMRGKAFNRDYFEKPFFFIMMIIIWPYFLVILTVGKVLFEIAIRICDFLDEKSYVTRLLYKIANMGYKEKEYILNFDTIDIKAPVAGRVTSIEVKINQVVSIKDCVAVIETENGKIPIMLSFDHLTSHGVGTVQIINVTVGEWVEADTTIVTLLGCSHEIYNRLVGE